MRKVYSFGVDETQAQPIVFEFQLDAKDVVEIARVMTLDQASEAGVEILRNRKLWLEHEDGRMVQLWPSTSESS